MLAFFNYLTLSSYLKWWKISCTIQFYSHVPYIWNSHELDRWKESATVERDGRTEYKGGSRERGGVWQVVASKLNWRKDVWWLDVQRSEGQVYPTCKDQFSFLGNRAWYEFIKLNMSTGLDEQIDLRKPSSVRVYRNRYCQSAISPGLLLSVFKIFQETSRIWPNL